MSIVLDSDTLTDLFCHIDDFCQAFLPQWKKSHLAPSNQRNRARSLAESEIMTLLITFHHSQCRNFKVFYLGIVCQYWKAAFPQLVSYNRFIEFVPSVLVPLAAYLKSLFGNCRGVTFIDSTALPVCNNRRIHQHQVFDGVAKRGKTSVDWFYGFKLHLAINDQGELLNVILTPGNVHDIRQAPSLLQPIFGKVFADKGYLSEPLKQRLQEQGIELITKVRKKMQSFALPPMDAYLLKKRALIESVIDQIKNASQVQHTRHRAKAGFLSNVISALIAYCQQPKKPSLHLWPALP